MKYPNFAIIITFFSLWLTVYFTELLEEIVGIGLIFTLGILHGSNDLNLISKLNTTSKSAKWLYFFLSYVSTVIVAGILFYYLPVLALIAFILFSSYHFGEQHWDKAFNKSLPLEGVLFLTYGLSILFLLFTLNSDATIKIIYDLTSLTINESWFLWGFVFSSILWIVQILISAYNRDFKVTSRLVFELFLMVVFGIVFKTASLVWGFAIYFIFWHSIPSIIEQQKFLYGEISWNSFFKYLKSSFLIWLVSISVLSITLLWLRNHSILLPLLFAFLGAITFAHSFVISKMFRLGKGESE